ncbi:MAG: universal stress protein [Bacteroidota bacterium]|nr:universal stress protein [Bacteroidota bacterium]
MKKYLAILDGLRITPATIEYSIKWAKKTNAHLVGVFLDDNFYHSYNYYEVLTSRKDSGKAFRDFRISDSQKRTQSVRLFEEACKKAEIPFTVHRDPGLALQELVRESMFADLIIINKTETFSRGMENPPTQFLKDFLGRVLCPVWVVPTKHRQIKTVVLLYNGKPSSLYAIKMFGYLFNEIQELPVEIFTVREQLKGALRFPQNTLLREYIKRHFPTATYKIVKGNVEDEVSKRFRNSSESQMIVLGAYQRGEVSRWFKTSMADILMKESKSSLFIAHSS